MTIIRRNANNKAEAASNEPLDWGVLVVYVVRGLAIWSLARALLNWAIILGAFDSDKSAFLNLPMAYQASTVFQAVIFVVAGIGLWLTSNWGGAIWLAAVVGGIVIDVTALIAGNETMVMMSRGLLTTLSDVALVAIYVVATAKAHLQRRPG